MRGRLGTRYEFLHEFSRPVEPDAGGSGYFGQAAESLDPRLFIEGTEQLKPEIRSELVSVLQDFWATRYVGMDSWAHLWIAGSSVTHQWKERTGKGDIDVLIGIEMPKFLELNRHLKSFPTKVIAEHMNAEFREHLWPAMEDYFGGEFEVTYYFNPGTGADIRVINPYAAYNLLTDQFDVRHEVPEDWGEHHIPEEWMRAVDAEIERAQEMIERHNAVAREVTAAPEGPRKVNLLNELGTLIDQIAAFYEQLHTERRHAYQGQFGVAGQGFFDYFNFRWQRFKQTGVGPTLNSIRRIGRDVERSAAEVRYGAPPAQDVLTPVTLKDYL